MTKSVELLNCTVLADPHINEYGILINAAGPAVIRGCRVENFKDIGIYLRGSKHVSRVAISDCHVAGCHAGVHIELGEYVATIDATCLQNNGCGLYIIPTAIGKIALNQFSFVENKSYNIRNVSAVEGILTVDGMVQETVKIGRPYQIPTELAARRCGQRAGICDINCLNCGRKEELDEKFKKCGKCEDVCYCSKECQKAHWKEHKNVALRGEIGRFQEGTTSVDELREVLKKYDMPTL